MVIHSLCIEDASFRTVADDVSLHFASSFSDTLVCAMTDACQKAIAS